MDNRQEFVYIIVARRWGDEESHNYIVGWCYNLSKAKGLANIHREQRGGKYAMIVEKVYEGYKPFKPRQEVYRAKSQAE